MTDRKINTKKIVGTAMFAALAFVVAYLCQFIPKVQNFLTPDAKDAVIVIASFIYGPIVAPIISFIVAFLEFITFSTTGPFGLLMNFASSTVFSLTASLIFRYKKSFNSAIFGLMLSVVATTAVMLILNPFIVPLYSGVTREIVVAMIPTVLLPFNFAKALLNSAVTIMLYKPVLAALSGAGMIKTKTASLNFNKNTRIILIVGSVALVLSVVIFIVLS